MNLVRWVLSVELDEAAQKNILIRVSGLRDRVAPDILELLDKLSLKPKIIPAECQPLF